MCIPGTATSRYVNFYTDFAFKKIFGTEANKDLLIGFLNDLLELSGDKMIESLTYLNSEQLGDSMDERRAVYDVYCSTFGGERFIVEMQKAKQDFFKDRAIYYSSFAVRSQGVRSGRLMPWDYRLSPVYVIGILNFQLDEGAEKNGRVISKVQLKDDDNEIFSDRLNYIFVEMPKFNKTEADLNTSLDKWLYVIKNLYKLKGKPEALTGAIFKKLFDVAEISAFSDKERGEYEESLKNFWDLNNVLTTAKSEGFAEGEAAGLERGRAEGLEKGRAEGEAAGLEKGRAEEKLATARNLKRLGIDSDKISKATGLTPEDIENL